MDQSDLEAHINVVLRNEVVHYMRLCIGFAVTRFEVAGSRGLNQAHVERSSLAPLLESDDGEASKLARASLATTVAGAAGENDSTTSPVLPAYDPDPTMTSLPRQEFGFALEVGS